MYSKQSMSVLYIPLFIMVVSDSFSTCQFCLPRAEKELFEREERAETQQEILKKVAKNLPVYTRTAGGGEAFTATAKLTVVVFVFKHPVNLRVG